MSIIKCSYNFYGEVEFETCYHFIITEADWCQTPSSLRKDEYSIERDAAKFALSSYAVQLNNIGIHK